MKKSFTVLLVALFLSPIYSLLAPTPAHADWLLDRSGTLIQVDGYVLGDDDAEVENEVEDTQKTETKESEQKQVEQSREIGKDRQELARESAKKNLENQIEARKKIQEKIGTRSQVEIKNENNKLKIKQEIRNNNDSLVKKQEIEIKDGERFVVEGENKEQVEINATKDGKLEIAKNRINTASNLNLHIDDKNNISVALSNGETKEIALPDKALARLVENGVITQTETEGSYDLTAGQNGNFVYRVKDAVVRKNFLGIKFNVHTQMDVAASDDATTDTTAGDVVSSEVTDRNPIIRFFARYAR